MSQPSVRLRLPPRSALGRVACFAALLLLSVVAWPGPASGQRLPPDPVEPFRDAVKLEQSRAGSPSLDDQAKVVLDFRRKNLKAAADRVRKASDLSRALLLVEWRSEGERTGAVRGLSGKEAAPDTEARKIEQDARKSLSDRFVARVQEIIKRGSAEQQVAVANLVRETVSSAGGQRDEDLRLFKDLAPLADDLVRLTRSPNARVRAAAALALGQFPNLPEKVVPALERLLGPGNPASTRQAAGQALSTLVQVVSGRESTPGSEPGISVRESKPNNFTFSPGEQFLVAARVVSAASRGLRDPNVEVRRACAEALFEAAVTMSERIPRPRSGTETEDPYPPRDRPWSPAERKKVQEGRDEVQKLKEELRPLLRAFADNARALAAASVDRDATVRITARKTFEEGGRARQLLKEFEESIPADPKGSREVRDRAPARPSRGAARLGAPVKVAPEVAVRLVQASVAPAEVADRPGILPPALVARQPKDADKDKDPEPLAKILAPELPGLIRSALRDPDVEGRRAALEAIERMGELARPYVGEIVKAMKDPDIFVRWMAARVLGKLSPTKAEVVVPALVAQLCDPDLDLRVAAVLAIGHFGPAAKSAAPALSKAVGRGDSEFRIAAMRAVEGVGYGAAEALPAIARQLTATDPRVRAEAARVLGRFGRAAARFVGALRPLTTDRDDNVRKAASEAILNIEGGR
jgi:HEAT repeat protein